MWTRSGQNSSGQGCDHQQERVCFIMSVWKNLGGGIKDLGCRCFTVFACLDLGLGPRIWVKTSHRGLHFRWVEVLPIEQIKLIFFSPPPLEFSSSPCRVHLLWWEMWEQRSPTPWSVSVLAQPGTSWYHRWEALGPCQQWQTTIICRRLPTEFTLALILFYQKSHIPVMFHQLLKMFTGR